MSTGDRARAPRAEIDEADGTVASADRRGPAVRADRDAASRALECSHRTPGLEIPLHQRDASPLVRGDDETPVRREREVELAASRVDRRAALLARRRVAKNEAPVSCRRCLLGHSEQPPVWRIRDPPDTGGGDDKADVGAYLPRRSVEETQVRVEASLACDCERPSVRTEGEGSRVARQPDRIAQPLERSRIEEEGRDRRPKEGRRRPGDGKDTAVGADGGRDSSPSGYTIPVAVTGYTIPIAAGLRRRSASRLLRVSTESSIATAWRASRSERSRSSSTSACAPRRWASWAVSGIAPARRRPPPCRRRRVLVRAGRRRRCRRRWRRRGGRRRR